MTFYVTRLTDPWNSVATLPGFSVEEAAECVQNDKSFRNCIPMTAEERKRFLNKCNVDRNSSYEDIYESMKDTFIYNQFLDGSTGSKISYSFWITSAYDLHSTVLAAGADTVGSYDFNLSRIAKRLGERYFYNFSTGKSRRVKDFSTLIRTLKDLGVRDIDITEEDLIEACNEDKYFIFKI